MLLLGLDRIGVRDPKTYAAGLKQARDVLDSGADRFWTTSQQQGVLALIVRMVVTGTLTQSDAATLTQSLFALPVASGDFHGALADWFQRVFAAKLPRGVNWQARAVAAAAGGPTPGAPILEWEGQRYSIDLAAGEQHRIIAVQEHQGGPDLDLAFTLNQLGRRALQASSIDNVRPLIAEAQAVLASSGAALARPAVNVLPPGVAARRDGREWLSKAIDDLERAGLLSDARFAEAYLRSHGDRLGAAKLRHALRGKGVDAGTVDAQIAAAGLPDEIERARDVWARKFPAPPADAREWGRQARFLQSRGFSADVIRRILKQIED